MTPKRAERRWTVYVLRCGDGSLYTGITDRLAERLVRHGAGKGAKYTRSRLPVALVWARGRQTGTDARRLEHALKRVSREDKVRLVAGDDRIWRRLRRGLVKGRGRAPRRAASRGRPSPAGRARGRRRCHGRCRRGPGLCYEGRREPFARSPGMNRLVRLVPILVVLGWAAPVFAGGYDTPMLYSARHMGMGGTAIGWVNDPSAMFHNPAGLAQVRGLSLMADFSPLIGSITGSPQALPETDSIESNTTFAPFFLVGAGYRITEWLAAGIAVYPVASAGATYEYDVGGEHVTDHTQLVFIEVAPGFALQLPHGIRVGAGYRINSTSLTRTREREGQDEPDLDLPLSGMNFFSFRAGVQYQPIPELEFGLVYRHKTVTDVEGDTARVPAGTLVATATDVSSSFTLPTRLGFGARGTFGAFRGALDLEYGLNSENESSIIKGDLGGILGVQEVPNIFKWSDALTLRVGVEYRLMEDKIATRLGYVFDAKTSNEQYPTAFGTPPGPTHVLTIGGGYDAGPWEVNLAYAYRFGTAEVTQEDIDSAEESCVFCSAPGDYAIGLHGIYIDFSIELFRPEPPPPPDPNADLVQPEPSTSAPPDGGATEPAATEPAATEPATTDPAATEPAPTDPAATP